MLTVTTDFCGGNAVIHSVTEDTIVFEPDIRDTEGTWFYWAFCGRGAQGKTVRFTQPNSRWVGYFGAAVSHDLYHWAWSNTAENNYADFTYHFGEDEDCVHFAHNLLYHPSRFHRLCERLGVSVNIPVMDRMGTPIPAAGLGDGANNILLTARHHCCEATGDYIRDGIME